MLCMLHSDHVVAPPPLKATYEKLTPKRIWLQNTPPCLLRGASRSSTQWPREIATWAGGRYLLLTSPENEKFVAHLGVVKKNLVILSMEITDSVNQRKEGPGATFGPRGPTNTAVCNYFYLKNHSSLPYFLPKVAIDNFPLPCGLVFLAPLVAQFRRPPAKKIDQNRPRGLHWGI